MPNSENVLVTGNDHFEVIEKTTVIDDTWPTHDQAIEDQTLDHFICRDGKTFAGTHLIADFWGASHLDDLALMEKALREAVEKAKATLLHIHLHHFTPNGGISGVAVLAESHISVHSWPERNYAAFDVFMCGDSEPAKAIEVLEAAFTPSKVGVDNILRGEVTDDNQS
ncbi:MAG: adenosylmethionine decarboxylase [Hydrogenovibrio crunogenus]|uniref:S-adenosylmethionine decarboxylase proenzyme n=2 Tax=Hydrogenovibrio crunogenus TaxID=39765 RepID=A0A4P7NXI8_9GAMM|nr:adenosylmethionine decarboxylase [Hydrogenovibrio crunogenus]MBD3611349.1 adenosylmethionine decarboxylase [Hydrogenovibrio crunogenus]QBZ82258.1 S-adenosylmethionine decarboxylase proenzyme [Hydrogenovibrio crunogenus]RUM92623.1 MAG: adenosylmethionine decarboxylase [Thiomicrospira sp.]